MTSEVLAIKQTLYRTSDDSPIVAALMHAAEKGKQVAVLVEVKARFDEANNIEWAAEAGERGRPRDLWRDGAEDAHQGHADRARGGGRRFGRIATSARATTTPKTARLYTDLGLLTCRPELGNDLVNLFHFSDRLRARSDVSQR